MKLAAAAAAIVTAAALTAALTLVTSSPAAPVATPPAAAATTSSAPRAAAHVAATVRVTFRDPSGRVRVESVPRDAVAPWCALTANRADVVLGAGTLATTSRAALHAARIPYPAKACQARRASGERRA